MIQAPTPITTKAIIIHERMTERKKAVEEKKKRIVGGELWPY
jgi:hypothetical protein